MAPLIKSVFEAPQDSLMMPLNQYIPDANKKLRTMSVCECYAKMGTLTQP